MCLRRLLWKFSLWASTTWLNNCLNKMEGINQTKRVRLNQCKVWIIYYSDYISLLLFYGSKFVLLNCYVIIQEVSLFVHYYCKINLLSSTILLHVFNDLIFLHYIENSSKKFLSNFESEKLSRFFLDPLEIADRTSILEPMR